MYNNVDLIGLLPEPDVAISYKPAWDCLSSYNRRIIMMAVSKVSQEVGTEIAENCRRRQRSLHCCLMSPTRRTSANIRVYLIFLETRIIGPHFYR